MEKSKGMIQRFWPLVFLIGFFLASALIAHAAPTIPELEDGRVAEDSTFSRRLDFGPAQATGLSVSASANNTSLIPPENISVTGSGASRVLTIVPEAEESGQARITISASDSSGTATESFNLEVFAINDAPTLDLPDAQEVNEGGQLTIGAAEGNPITVDDIDAGTNSVETRVTAENGTLEVPANAGTVVTGNETSQVTLQGRISQINDALDGLIYVPNPDFFGIDMVEVRIDDQGHTGGVDNPFEDPEKTARGSFEVNVLPVNDPPEIAAPESAETLEDTPLVFSEEEGNPILVSDIDAGDEAVRITISIDDGLLYVQEEDAELVSGIGTPELTFSAPVAEANEILDGLTAEVGPVEIIDGGGFGEDQERVRPNWSGETLLEISVNDLGNTGAGGALSDQWTIPIEVVSVNDAPTISLSAARFLLDEDGSRLFGSDAVVLRDVDAGDNPLILSLSWPEGNLTIPDVDGVDRLETGPGAAELEGALDSLNSLLSGLIFTPEPDWNGEVELRIAVDDQGHSGETGEAQTAERVLTLVVRPVPDAPALEMIDTIEMRPIDMNDDDPSGELVADLLEDRVADADGNPDEIGMAVVFVENDHGEWQFSTDDGDSWTPFPEGIGEDASVLLGPDARIRFVPEADWEGFAELDFRLWDGSDGAASGAVGVDISEVGGRTAFGVEIGMASILVGDPPPLVADAGPNRNAAEGETVLLDGSDSRTPADVTTAFFWEQIAGPDVSLSDAQAIQPTFVVPDIGPEGEEFIFRLTLTAEGLPESSDDVRVSATQDMTIVAEAGGDLSVPENTEVVLDGTGSRIPDGMTVGVEWTQIDGPEVTLGNATTLTPFFTSPTVDQDTALAFRLVLTGLDGNEIADSVQITVTDQPAIRADAGPDQTVEEGATVTLSGTGSFVESGVTALYQWTQTAGPSVSLANSASAETTFIAPEAGPNQPEILTFSLEVRNNAGDEADTDEVTIQVLDAGPASAPPTANAGANQQVSPGASVTLDGAASFDSDGTIDAYQWTQLSGLTVAISNANAATAFFTAPAGTGTLTFQLTVTDNSGLTGQDTVSVTVSGGVPPGPGAGEPLEVREGETVRLNVTPSPDFGAATGYQWTQISGTAVALSDPNAQRPSLVPTPATVGQTLVFEATLTNAQGQTQDNTLEIRVLDNGITGYPEDVITFRPTYQHTMGIRMGGAANVVALDPVDVANTDTGGRPAAIPFGLATYTFRVAAPGDSAAATLFLATPQTNAYQWFVYDEGSGWRAFGDNASLSEDGARVTLTVTDGGPGDEDGVANGLIRHTGGMASNTPTGPGGDGGEDGGAGDSGCFIRTLLGFE